jgi:hypothetical protein
MTTNLIEELRLLSPPTYGGWLAAGLMVILAAGFFALWHARRRRTDSGSIGVSGAPLWDVALAELERLIPLLRAEQSREYAIQSTGILRRYIEGRYALQAPRLATEEFLAAAAKSAALPAEHRGSLRHFLELCDLLKFGRYLASAGELEPLHAAAVAFVLASRPGAGTFSSPAQRLESETRTSPPRPPMAAEKATGGTA